MEKESKLILECDCHGEMLVCNEVLESYGPQNRQEFTLAFFSYGFYNGKPSMWERIKYAWRHLRTGKIYEDCVILNDEKAEQLAKFLRDGIAKYRSINLDEPLIDSSNTKEFFEINEHSNN